LRQAVFALRLPKAWPCRPTLASATAASVWPSIMCLEHALWQSDEPPSNLTWTMRRRPGCVEWTIEAYLPLPCWLRCL
jgi:hypothetical protein